jgi:hypothetical protein
MHTNEHTHNGRCTYVDINTDADTHPRTHYTVQLIIKISGVSGKIIIIVKEISYYFGFVCG